MKAVVLLLVLSSGLSAATFTAATCSNANLQSAINMTSPGDTVVVGSGGTVTWSGNVTISNTQALTLDGTGCTIAGSGGTIEITLGTLGSTRVTGFHTTGPYAGAPYFIDASGTPSTKYLRIDHNTFTDSTTGDTFITVAGNPTNLIDHNTFNTNGQASEIIHNFGYGAGVVTGWENDVTPGGPNQMYVETNTFNGVTSQNDKAIESYYGSQTVLRYNSFVNYIVLDQHGTPGSVGARWWEFYQNTWSGTTFGYAALRGGSGVFYQNHLTGTNSGAPPSVGIFEEDSGYPADPYQPGRGIAINVSGNSCTGNCSYPSPIYAWGNDSNIQTNVGSNSSNVVAGRDFFCWSGSVWGATCSNTSTNISAMTRCESAADESGSTPTSIGSGSSGTCNTTYTYSAFTYPYPLDANGMPNPAGTPTVATPTFSPVAGTYTTSQSVTISDATGGATICYTTDGSTPLAATPGTCSHGTAYSGAVTVSVSETLMAIGTLTSYTNSAVGSAAYTLQVLTPTFSPVAGSYGSTQMVTISDATMSAVICYTTDGTAPTATSPGTCTHGTTYAGTVTVASSLTLNAIGTLSGWSNSAQGQAIYTITGGGSTGGTLTGGAVCSGGCKIQ